MGWNWFAFADFVGLGLGGAIAGGLVLLLEGKRVGVLETKGWRMSDTSFSRGNVGALRFAIVTAVAILVAGAASALTSLLPFLFSPERLGVSENILQMIHWASVVAFVSMLFGMAASYFNRLINERRARIEELRRKGDSSRPGLEFDLWDFVQPFLVSLITFGAIVARVHDLDTLTNILLGFETGFFWQTILANRAPAGNVALTR